MRTHARSLWGCILAGFLSLSLGACKNPAPVVGPVGSHDVAFSGTNVTFSSTSPQSVPDGETLSLTVTPNSGYALDTDVGGTCAAGTWNGNVYTTGFIRSNCTLTFAATEAAVYTLTAGNDANGTIAPTGVFTVASGASQVFTATPNANYSVADWRLDGNIVQMGGTTYTLANITANHTVEVTFRIEQYTVTPTSGANGSIAPSTPQTVNSGATLTFTATPDVGYQVAQWLVDGLPAQVGGTTYDLTNISANHTVQVTFGAATLTTSVSSIALSVNCQPASSCTTTQNAALTGNSRQIVIQNTGTLSATNVAVNASGLPSGTVITTNTCAVTLSAGSSCSVSLTPGSVASSDAGSTACTAGTQPVGGTVTITADGGLSTQVGVYVLSYGCQYQGGFIYAVDDTTPGSGSIGGKVASLSDLAEPYISSGPQPTSVIWSSNGSGGSSGDVSYDIIPLISEINTSSDSYAQSQTIFDTTYSNTSTFPFPSSSAFASCDGSSDGACNANNILALYNTYITQYGVGGSPYVLSTGPTNLFYYAAGLCSPTIGGYSDWYLPAVCELDAVGGNVTCPSVAQSMNGNLSFLVGDPSAVTPSTSCSPPSGTHCLAGMYWSSTQSSTVPQNTAWYAEFTSGGGNQFSGAKDLGLGVRCARALTP